MTQEVGKIVPMPNPINEIDLIFGKYRMTKEYGDEIQSSEFVINNLLIAGTEIIK